MVVRILLLAGDEPSDTVEISRTVVLDPSGPGWQRELVSAIGEHARETARCLVDQMEPTLPASPPGFIPLAHVLPTCG